MSADPNQNELPFTKVIRKSRFTKLRPKQIPRISANIPLTEEEKSRAIRYIEEAKGDITESDWFQSILGSLKESLAILKQPSIKEFICLGLGKVGECLPSKYQLAFLLCLRGLYKIEVKVYDPAFSEDDQHLLKHFNVTVLTENLEGKYKTNEYTTIFYLPHCSNHLTNNLLWANWGLNLQYCLVICNSFSGIYEQHLSQWVKRNLEYIFAISPHASELTIPNTFKLYDIFNDTAIHIFPLSNLELLPNDFWNDCSEPTFVEGTSWELMRNNLINA